jgi:hypothetical protein
MHHVLGAMAVGAILGQSARRSIWRPVVRNAIKRGLVVVREAKALIQNVRAKASDIVAEAEAELSQERLNRVRPLGHAMVGPAAQSRTGNAVETAPTQARHAKRRRETEQ